MTHHEGGVDRQCGEIGRVERANALVGQVTRAHVGVGLDQFGGELGVEAAQHHRALHASVARSGKEARDGNGVALVPLVVQGLSKVDVANVLSGAEQQRVKATQHGRIGGVEVIQRNEGQGGEQWRLGRGARCEGDVEALLFQIQRSVSAEEAGASYYQCFHVLLP